MTKELTQEQYWKYFQNISDELKNAIFSDETAENIFDVCDRNDLSLEKITEIARYSGRVLLGVLLPEDFQKTLEKELGLETEIAKKIAHEINRFVFYPVKPALEQLYNIGIATGEKKPETIPLKTGEKELPAEEKTATPSKADTYREPIE
ncbi:MAG: hypothetical protein A2175_01430 [Candidatus Nealsonbacteria bacterium RBG_13_42_11]|uniref:Uncharacterized protein n=1 Tax=Candidatus Nealsonbacteria bacterium RBG_13_42_11 TaxID=1801663 RepID=A0A1G2DZY4_9BACT|nr:MAG: hypothetical protein A2175_01430 [Candidatus Nealsonbacteria bacterium RBG_13_42_11]